MTAFSPPAQYPSITFGGKTVGVWMQINPLAIPELIVAYNDPAQGWLNQLQFGTQPQSVAAWQALLDAQGGDYVKLIKTLLAEINAVLAAIFGTAPPAPALAPSSTFSVDAFNAALSANFLLTAASGSPQITAK